MQKHVAKVVGMEGEVQARRDPLTQNADVVGRTVGHLHTNTVRLGFGVQPLISCSGSPKDEP